MRFGSTRALAIALLLALAAPPPRVMVWLHGSLPLRPPADGRHEPQARGRNRIPMSPRAAETIARACLASGDEGRQTPPDIPFAARLDAHRDRAALSGRARPASPLPGSLHLRC